MIKIKPLHNNVLIEPLTEEERGVKTKSGIIIPETVDKEKPDQGRVIEVGPGKRDENGKIIPMSVKKGQKVIFSRPYSVEEIKVDNKKYFIINEENILAIIE
jgi:chaperonin GroES